ncbi:MAG: helical backbone metal receptor [Bacteroidetes bacterium]|nr:helical backbone metal receptor [Bacteroidota bacterium]
MISLVPSQTELLFELGLKEEVVGITNFCVHPEEWYRTKTRVGGTKKIDLEKIKALKPDLIIGNKEENDQFQIEELMKDYKVWMSDIYTLKDALNMILSLGMVLDKHKEATNIKLQIESDFKHFIPLEYLSDRGLESNQRYWQKVAYFIWNDPYMVAGNNTFINEMLKTCGLQNVFNADRYPEVNVTQIKSAAPEIIFLSSEPFPFKEKQVLEFQRMCPDAIVLVVDGEIFSWYGSRLLKATTYFKQLIEKISSH